jgi:hypothetical protein
MDALPSKVGSEANKCLAFSYGYLCFTEDGSQPLLPEYTAKGLQFKLGNQSLTARQAQRLCLTSYASTALDYSSNVLCEMNDLGIKDRQPLYLTSLIAESDEAAANEVVRDWKKSLDKLQLGGERNYGFGRLELRGCPSGAVNWFGTEFISDDGRPKVKILKGNVLTAHTAARDCRVSYGQVEPFVGRTTTSQAEFGKNIECIGVCWLPGSVLDEEVVTCQIDEQGKWNPCK